jgi:hypothetical protein
MPLNNDSSAHKRCREPKLVWLELSGHEDSEYVRKKFLSVNETAVQNIWQHNFLQPGALSEVVESVAHIWPQVVEISSLQEFIKMIDFSHWHIYDSHS